MDLESKVERVKRALRGERIAVGFSGGADSTALLDMAADVADTVVAFTVDTGVMPRGFIEGASGIAREIGVEHVVLEMNLLENVEFAKNAADRCFVCKNIIYSSIIREAHKRGLDVVADGTTASDMFEDRPGVLVNHLLGIRTPLLDAGMKRSDVIEYLRSRGLNYLEETTCLATRIRTGEEITPERINRISYAESLIRGVYGDGKIRVRHEGESAIIEVDEPERLLEAPIIRHLDDELRAVGFRRVLLDLTGRKTPDEAMIYRPCRDAESRIMFEVKLPYSIDIARTCRELMDRGPRCSEKMGVIMLEAGDGNVTIFRNGKIVARRVRDQEEAEDVLLEVIPHIIREPVS